jgi:hypothetical protein
MQQNIDFTANLQAPAPRPARNWLSGFTRGRLVGLAGAVVMVGLYFGGVVWVGQDLAADMKAGTREVTAGMMVPDLEG